MAGLSTRRGHALGSGALGMWTMCRRPPQCMQVQATLRKSNSTKEDKGMHKGSNND